MKMVPKKQDGGSFLSIFADYPIFNPGNVASPATSSGKSSKKSNDEDSTKGKITEKDLFTILSQVDGLPNEMEALSNEVYALYLNSDSLGSFDGSSLAGAYAQAISNLKRANFNKKEWDKAFEKVNKNEGLNSAAITNTGELVVYDRNSEDKTFSYVSVKKYLNNPQNYMVITNNDLLSLRAQDPKLINNNNILPIIQNGIGIEKVREYIKTTFSNLGTSDVELEGYTSKQKENIVGGIQILDQLTQQQVAANMTIDGLYKNKVISKEQKMQAESALNFIYNTLPQQAKTMLQLQSGYAKDPVEGAKALISQFIISQQNIAKSVSVDYEGTLSSDGSLQSSKGKGSTKDIQDEPTTMPEMFLRGLGSKGMFEINPGTNSSTIVYSNTLPLTDKSGNPLGVYSSLTEASKGQYSSILDWNNATMAGRKVNLASSDNILIVDGNISSIDFPIDINGNPDLSPITVKKKQEADSIISSKGIDLKDPQSIKENIEEINNIYKEAGLSAAYDSTGTLRQGWRRFGVMNCVTDDRSLGIDTWEDSSLYKEVTDDNEIKEIVRNIQSKNEDYSYSSGFINWNKDTLIESTLWIPLIVDYNNASIGNMRTIRQSTAIEEEQLILNRRNQLLQQYNHKENP